MRKSSLHKEPVSVRRQFSRTAARLQQHVESLERRALMSAGDLIGSVQLTNFGGTFANPKGDTAMSVAIQANGRIVSGGSSFDTVTSNSTFALTRHLANGSIDTSFGDDLNGKVTTAFAEGSSGIMAVAVDNQQRIVAMGTANGALALARYDSDGDLDTTFGFQGRAVFPNFPHGSPTPMTMVIDSSNRILVSTTVQDPSTFEIDMAVIRIRADGDDTDSTFGGGDGVAIGGTSGSDAGGALAIDGAGNIVQAGFVVTGNLPSGAFTGRLITARYSSSGAPDTTYGNNSNGVLDSSLPMDQVNGAYVDVDGSLIVAGDTSFDGTNGFATGALTLARVAADGSDVVNSHVTPLQTQERLWALAPQADGKILVAGNDYPGGSSAKHYVLARFNTIPDAVGDPVDLSLDTGFATGGVYTSPIAGDSAGYAVLPDSQGQIVVAGTAPGVGEGAGDFMLARHDAALVAGGPNMVADADAREDTTNPYELHEGSFIQLTGFGSLVTGGVGGVTFDASTRRATGGTTPGSEGEVVLTWDLDGDGNFGETGLDAELGDETGATPTLIASPDLDGEPGRTIDVTLRVANVLDQNQFIDDTVQVLVKNIAPSAAFTLPATPVDEGVPLLINGSASDPGPDTLDLDWTVTLNGDNTVIDTGSGQAFSFTPPDQGVYDVKLVVSDGDGGSATVIHQLTAINANPTALINGSLSRTVNEGTQVNFSAVADDVDGDLNTLTKSWSVTKNGVPFTSGGNVDNFAFTPDDNGAYLVTFTANDGEGGTAESVATVTVNNVAPSSPTVSGDLVGVRGQTRTLNLSALDDGAADVTAKFIYTIDWGDGSPVDTIAQGTTTASHVFADNGTYSVSVIATDKDNASSTPSIVTMLTQATELENGTLTVAGSTGADNLRFFRIGGLVAVGNITAGGIEFVQTYTDPIDRVVILGGNGDDTVDASAFNVAVEIYGGPGDDRLTGGSAADILVGGDGHDRLEGRGGRDIMIGGDGEDRLLGDSDEDILVGGYTAHDANMLGLRAIRDEWRSGRTYQQRVDNIRGITPGTPRLNGNTFLRADSTVWDDAYRDILAGNAGQDWFFFNNDRSTARDRVVDANSSEFQDEVDLQP